MWISKFLISWEAWSEWTRLNLRPVPVEYYGNLTNGQIPRKLKPPSSEKGVWWDGP